MEVDINEPKSKAFNVFLTCLSQLILAYWASKHEQHHMRLHLTEHYQLHCPMLWLASISLHHSHCCAKKFPRILFILQAGFSPLLSQSLLANDPRNFPMRSCQSLLGVLILYCFRQHYCNLHSNIFNEAGVGTKIYQCSWKNIALAILFECTNGVPDLTFSCSSLALALPLSVC